MNSDFPKSTLANHRLAYRILVLFLIISALLVITSTAFRIFSAYQTEQNNISTRLSLIESSQIDGITKSLWNLDKEQIRLQLQGIMNFPDIQAVALNSIDWSDNISFGHVPAEDKAVSGLTLFPIDYTEQGAEPRRLGTLHVYQDIEAIKSRLFHEAIWSLVTQAILIIAIGLVLLVIVHINITRHLERMAVFAQNIGKGDLATPLKLYRGKRNHHTDELDEVANSINDMRLAIIKDIQRREQEEQELRYSRDQLQEQVERRTQNLREAKEAAESASQAKSKFLATMSHEIRTPLNGILGMVQLMSASSMSDEQKHQLETIYYSGDALLEILNGLLDYARLEEGAYMLEKQPFSLNHLIETSCHLFSARASEKGLMLSYSEDDSVTDSCIGAVGALRQVLTNLISNAVKFTRHGSIRVETKLIDSPTSSDDDNIADQWLRISVIDNGIGISHNDCSKIFERFSQADDSIARQFGGTGLGLSISQKLIENMGGQIGVESELGKGSCFWFTVPLKVNHEQPAALNMTTTMSPEQTLRILLVEDMPINQEVTKSLLERDNHQVTIACDGFLALDTLNTQEFDVILLDVQLPGMSGLEVARELKKSAGLNQDTPLIALTANVQPSNINEYHQAGICAVVSKPLKIDRLYQAIVEAVNCDTDRTSSQNIPMIDQTIFNSHEKLLGKDRAKNLSVIFAKSIDKIIPKISQGVQGRDYYEVNQQAHRLAGDAESIGATQLSKALRDIESLADNRSDWLAIDAEFKKIKTLAELTVNELEIRV
jgi:two-component system, OmpR family, sensor histidine kinase TorS